jgi:uncharacterized Fe-S cluster protein YjdI
MSAIADAIFNSVKAQIPGGADRVMRLALIQSVSDLCRDALQIAAPTDETADLGTWLTDAQWLEHGNLVLSGALARLFAQPGKPYSNPQLAEAHGQLFSAGLTRARTVDAPAQATANEFEHLRALLRTELPSARDPVLLVHLADEVDLLATDLLGQAPDHGLPLASRLTEPQWIEYRELLFHGTLARLYAQTQQPWTSGEAAKYHADERALRFARLKALATTAAPMTAVSDRLLQQLRVEAPLARDNILTKALFETVDPLCRDVLQISPPAGGDPNAWLTSDLYAEHYDLLLHGALSRVFSEVAQPWANPDAAKYHLDAWTSLKAKVRADLATPKTGSGAGQILNELRVAFPTARDGVLQLALYKAVDRLARDALQTTPPDANAVTFDLWLSAGDWAEHYQTLLAGAKAWLYAETGQPWADAAAFAIATTQFEAGLAKVRATLAQVAVASPDELALAELRVAFPTARDGVLEQALYKAVDRLARDALQVTPPSYAAAPAAWLTAAQWTEHYAAVLHGAKTWLYAQTGQPWADAAAAKAHEEAWTAGLAQARTVDASAQSITSEYERLRKVLRTDVPQARDNLIVEHLSAAVIALCQDVLQIPVNQGAAIEDWLTDAQWLEHNALLRHGALARLYALVDQPWTSADAAKLHLDAWTAGTALARSNLATPSVASPAELGLAELRVAFPAARNGVLELALFKAADRLARDALQTTPPNYTAAPDTWLTAAQWTEHYPTVLHGAKAALYAQAGQPWADAAAAQVCDEAWRAGLAQARTIDASTQTFSSEYQRLRAVLRTDVPQARDNLIIHHLSAVIVALCQDVLQIPVNQGAAIEDWLTDGQWLEHNALLRHGVLARLYAMVDQPWTNPTAAQEHAEAWGTGLARTRAVAASAVSLTGPADRVLVQLRTEVPLARDSVLLKALGETVDVLARDVLQSTPPSGGDPAAWLSAEAWGTHADFLVHGTLARLFAQVAQPWTSAEAAKYHLDAWTALYGRARETAAAVASAPDAYARLLANLRSAVPLAHDPLLLQELFNVVDDLTRTTLQTTPPVHGAAPASWLTAAQWEQHYRLLFAGTMARLLTQSGKPWTDPDLAQVQQALYAEQLVLARGDANAALSVPTALDRVMDVLRVRLPGAKDSVIHLELFNAIDEFCRHAYAWVETITVPLVAGQTVYAVTPAGTEIVEALSIDHATLQSAGIVYSAGTIALDGAPEADDLATPLALVAVLTPSPLNTAPADWLPADLVAKHYAALVDGTLSKMMMQAAKPYSNPALAQFHGRRFRNAIALATVDARTGDVAGVRAWSFPRFA